MSIAGSPPSADHELLEARLGAGLSRLLTEGSLELAPDALERLRFARERALARAKAQDGRAAPVSLGGAVGGASILGQVGSWWPGLPGLAGLVSAIGLALGLLTLDHWQIRERAHVAAEVDALLLADQLPPAAYSDPGFVAFLKLSQP